MFYHAYVHVGAILQARGHVHACILASVRACMRATVYTYLRTLRMFVCLCVGVCVRACVSLICSRWPYTLTRMSAHINTSDLPTSKKT